MTSLYPDKINKEIIPALQEKFGLKNKYQVPKLQKVTINVGISAGRRDDSYMENIKNNLQRMSGQKPVFTLAKKAISSFKIRQGNVVGAKVTLRGRRMYDFVDKLIHVTLPRVRDFRGIDPKTVDKQGNLNIGFKEHIAFAEIDPSEVDQIHGLEVNLKTDTENREQALEFFSLLGIPFKKNN